ncbi:serine/threonine-protein kinase [Deinococcus sp. MIMF12]|uniref:Serine/threonine-protein kinase n=1 Tax=Deinococcus rhizophilus TaxID=3049544 RepID=A0ABT7JDR4_9DEIO|nr:serine/threonine-protein kinase [Deinococcus rhizophilus]MDL2343091.1 serine/threonine-protein kinase [Deinococcus rhizophilus]
MIPERSSSDRTPPGYRLLQVLGRGQTSLVHLAQDPRGREVALKVPLECTLRDQEAAERFANEVRLTLQFRHPHVIRGYAGSPFGARAYLALRHYAEGTLSDALAGHARGARPVESPLRLLADLASGLAYLHALGVVHQDVKPQNVYLDGGRAALGDLGSAYFTAQGGHASGSPFYMAPEIYRGDPSSPASDVYSLGVLAHEVLAGARPFQGDTYEELMAAHLNRFAPPLSAHCPELARPVARLLDLCLAKRPGDRPAADALRRALLTALGEKDEEACPPLAQAPAPRPVGRHAPVGDLPATPEAADAGSRWNPFKRRK